MLRCPVCLNLSVQDSPSELARDMRDLVRERVKQGDSERQVLGYFIARYGEWVLMKPPAHGVSLFVWVLPAVVIVAGGALVVLAMRRWVGRTAPAAGAVPDVSEEDLRKVREALSRERQNLD
jgi:cytochrome c-type biogenesis protein CcmH